LTRRAQENSGLRGPKKVALALLCDTAGTKREDDMTTKLKRYAKMAAGLLTIELLVPGGTLIVLTLLLTGAALPIPDKLAAALPILDLFKRP
jgi:hypothetical protein